MRLDIFIEDFYKLFFRFRILNVGLKQTLLTEKLGKSYTMLF